MAMAEIGPRQRPGGRLGGVVTVVVGVDVYVGVLVTVTVLVLVDGGGTSVVVVIVVTLVVVEVDEVVVADDAASTPQATRLPDSPVELPLKLSAVWWTTSAVPELLLRSAAVNRLVVVTSFPEPSFRTCNAVRSPLAGKPV
jgi:hypothetical protein